MALWKVAFVCVIVLNFSVNLVAELTMPSCIRGWTPVQENKRTAITCSHPSQTQTVHWRIEDSTRNQTLFEGSCAISRKKCNFSTNDDSSLYMDHDFSSLVIKTTNVRKYGDATVTCADSKIYKQCRINVIHDPNISQCKVEVHTANRTVTGSCNIDKFFSSDNPISCLAIQRMGKTADHNKYLQSLMFLQDYTDQEDNKPYKRGNCRFKTDLPTAIGNYTYTIVVAPSKEENTAAKIEIETDCTIFLGVNPKCSWECLKRPGDTPSYVCNPSERHRTLKVNTSPSPRFISSFPAHLGSSSSAHYASSQPVHLITFLSATFDSPSTQLVPFDLSTLHPSKNRPPAVANIVAGVVVPLVVIIILIIIIYIVKRKENHPVAQNECSSREKRQSDDYSRGVN